MGRDREKARELQDEAIAIAQEPGMKPMLERVLAPLTPVATATARLTIRPPSRRRAASASSQT